jgi:hypothetical protein
VGETKDSASAVLDVLAEEPRRLLEQAYVRLGNPFVMIDTSYNLLYHTENRVGDDPIWNELVALGRFSHETVDFFNEARFIQAFADSEAVALMQNDRLPYDRACATLFDEAGLQLGSIVAVACYRPFAEGDFAEMALLCEQIAGAVYRGGCQPSERVYYDAFLSDLLAGRTSPADPALAAVRADLKDYLFLLAADVSRYERTLTHLAYFRDLFARLGAGYKCYLHLDNVVVLTSAPTPDPEADGALKPLNDFFLRYNIVAGLSGAFQNLSDARPYFRQALFALNRGMSEPAGRGIFKYGNGPG